MKKQIILVPGTIARRLQEAKISFDIMMSPDLIASHLSMTEIATIEILNSRIVELLHPALLLFDKSTVPVSPHRNTAYNSYVMISWLERLRGLPCSTATNETLFSVLPGIMTAKLNDIMVQLRTPTWFASTIKEPFTTVDTDPSFSIVIVHEGFLTGNILNTVGSSERSLISLTEEFIELLLSILYKYHPMHEVNGTDCFGLYLHTLNAKLTNK